MSPGEKFIKVILAQDELDPLDVVRVLSPAGTDEVDLVIVQGLHGLQHFPGNSNQWRLEVEVMEDGQT